MITAVAAMDLDGLIGLDDELPWQPAHQWADIWRLRRVTYGHPIIVGSNTFANLSTFKAKRRIVVLTRNRGVLNDEGVLNERHRSAGTMGDALRLAIEFRRETFSDRTIIAGGASVYEQTIDLWDRLELTIVHKRTEFDPKLVAAHYLPSAVLASVKRYGEGSCGRSAFWVSAVSHQSTDDRNRYPMTFLTMVARRHDKA